MIRSRPALLALLTASISLTAIPAQDRVRGHLIRINDNGAWSWFEDERAVVDRFAGRILVGSCADSSGLGGTIRGGDIDVVDLDLQTGRVRRFELHDRLQGDDHNSPALLVRPDGRYLAMFGMHGGSGTAPLLSRWRISTLPGDPTSWTPERTFRHSRSMSYSNLHHLPDARGGLGVTYNFVRATNLDPNVMVSHDLGDSFTGTGKLLTEGGTSDRPYVKYASDGSRRVHLITTERHPRNYDNGIYHGYVQNGALHTSFGAVVDPNILDSQGQRPSALTQVFATGTTSGGVIMRRAWTIDIAVDQGGTVRALYQARARDLSTDHRLFFARFDGTAWTSHEVCALGAGLYSPENDYTGLAALDPDDPDRLFVSTPIDPRTNASLAHHEIFEGTTTDLGRTWSWLPITEGSTVDNLRPIVPAWGPSRTALLWLRGNYSTYTSYHLAVVGTVDAPELSIDALTYVDATLANTSLAAGGAFSPTGPSASPGAADGRWHQRTGFGNGGSVLTSDENVAENVPALRIRAAGLAAGAHDVFVMFWSNPNEDWLIAAGLEPSALDVFEKRAAEHPDASDFVTPVVRTGSTVALYAAYLGRADVGAAGTLDVFVDDLSTAQSGRTRTWFDGIALAPIRAPASVEEIGRGCGGPPALAVGGSAVLGGPGLTFTLGGGVPGATAWLLFGFGPLIPVDLRAVGFAGCTVYPRVAGAALLGTLSPTGTSNPLHIVVPADPALRGGRAAFQGVFVTPSGGLGTTAAQVARLGT